MSNFGSIRTSIYNKCLSLTSVADANTKKFGSANPEGFPFLTVESMGNDSVIQDEINNLRTYKYRVKIFIEMNKQNLGQSSAEDVLMVVLDEIVDAFDEDYTLGQTVENIKAVKVETGYVTIASGEARVAEMILQVEKLEPII